MHVETGVSFLPLDQDDHQYIATNYIKQHSINLLVYWDKVA